MRVAQALRATMTRAVHAVMALWAVVVDFARERRAGRVCLSDALVVDAGPPIAVGIAQALPKEDAGTADADGIIVALCVLIADLGATFVSQRPVPFGAVDGLGPAARDREQDREAAPREARARSPAGTACSVRFARRFHVPVYGHL